MTTTRTIRNYHIDPTGTIFTSDVMQFLDDNGNVLASGNPMRTPYPPSNSPPSSTLNGAADATLTAMATAIWTPAVVSAYAANAATPPTF